MSIAHTSSGKNTVTDIVIVGGGPTGLLAAIGLAQRGWSVEVWDRTSLAIQEAQKEQGTPKGWGIFITYSTYDDLINIIGRSPDLPMAPVRCFSLGDIASGKTVRLEKTVETQDQDTPFGWGIDTVWLRAYLLQLVATDQMLSKLITLRGNCSPEHVVTTQTGCLIRSKSGEQVRAGLVVAADGRLSHSRTLCGIKATTRPFGKSALLVRVVHTSLQPDHGLELYDTDGPAVFLPMPGGASNLTWVGSGAEIDALASLESTELADIVQNLMPDWMGDISAVQSCMMKPLIQVYAANPTAQRAVAIGDAANGLHPLFAQGFNLAVRDVAALCHHLGDKKADHTYSSDVQKKLTKYARARRYDHMKTQSITTVASKGLSATGPFGAIMRAGVPILLSRFTPLQSIATRVLGEKKA